MPTISESELNNEDATPCSQCNNFASDVWLCGEGGLCAYCFAAAAEIPEEDVLAGSINDEQRTRVKAHLGRIDDQV